MPVGTSQLLIEMCLNVVRVMTSEKFWNVRKEVESIMGGKVLETIGERMILRERQEVKDETVVRRLLRFAKRHAQPGQQDIQEIAEDSDVSVERVRELAGKNGIDLA